MSCILFKSVHSKYIVRGSISFPRLLSFYFIFLRPQEKIKIKKHYTSKNKIKSNIKKLKNEKSKLVLVRMSRYWICISVNGFFFSFNIGRVLREKRREEEDAENVCVKDLPQMEMK